ncbi:MAG: metal ABC transporter permease [Candidatus Colwellbacteria bacterium]|nr:metal ABC transporter permease [Candidatus Colwellbacteria bacterium]
MEMLQYPFMQRALIAGVILGAVLAYIGIFVVLRRMSFFGDGISHASLAGVAAGIALGIDPLLTAVVVSAVFAVIIYLLESKGGLSGDAMIGIIFTSGMALGAVMMSLRSGYQPELISFLFGNILAIGTKELLLISSLSLMVGIVLFLWRRKLTLLSIDEELAVVSGINPNIYKLLLYVFVAIVAVLGIKILGIVLVSAALIIPVSMAKMFSPSFRSMSVFTVLISEVIMLGGMMVSYIFDLPAGAAIVLFGSTFFFIGYFVRSLLKGR